MVKLQYSLMPSKKRKPSERIVKCYYCSEELQVKHLERHTKRSHGDNKTFPPRVKGVLSLMEFSQKKKQKVNPRPGRPRPHPESYLADKKNTDDPARTGEKSLLSLSQISDTVRSFFALLNPFRNAVSSLVKSTKKIEELLQDKDEIRSRQISKYFSHEAFAREHKAEGLIMSSSQGMFYGFCMVCTKHTNAIRSVSSFDAAWIIHGRRLDEHKKRTWERHLQSQMHKQAQNLESQPDISAFISAGAQKAKMLTQNFLRLTYSAILMFLPY